MGLPSSLPSARRRSKSGSKKTGDLTTYDDRQKRPLYELVKAYEKAVKLPSVAQAVKNDAFKPVTDIIEGMREVTENFQPPPTPATSRDAVSNLAQAIFVDDVIDDLAGLTLDQGTPLKPPVWYQNYQGSFGLAAAPEGAFKVAVYSSSQYVEEQLAPLAAKHPSTVFIDKPLTPDTAELAAGADAVCLFVNDDASAESLRKLSAVGVRLVLMRCAGFDRVDLSEADALGIKVTRVPAYDPHAVAEHALTLAMCVNRNVHTAQQRVKSGNFSMTGLVGRTLHGKTVGIVGTGKIGTLAAEIFKGLGMTVLAYDVYKNDAISKLGGKYVELDELYGKADVISLHVPLLPTTRKMVNSDAITKMKDGVILVNCSRGGLVDTQAIIDGIVAGKIGGVGLDVYENEANLFFRDLNVLPAVERAAAWDPLFAKLVSLPNVVVTPHSAFLTQEALENICETTMSNIEDFVKGGELSNEVKP